MLQAEEVIQPSTSLWAFPVVLVGKKDYSVRFCMGCRKLNAVPKFNDPMPRIDEVLEHIRPASVISTLDLAKGYWQIPLTPSAKEKTAITSTSFGLYEFQVMPFGLYSSPVTFQCMMDHMLHCVRGTPRLTSTMCCFQRILGDPSCTPGISLHATSSSWLDAQSGQVHDWPL